MGRRHTGRRELRCQWWVRPVLTDSNQPPASSSSSSSKSSFFFSSSSGLLLASSAKAVRKRSAEESTTSPDAPVSTGRPSVGRVSREECRRLQSLLRGPGSARMPRSRWTLLLSPWRVVRRVSLRLSRLLHHHQSPMAVPCPEPALSPPCSGSHAFSHG